MLRLLQSVNKKSAVAAVWIAAASVCFAASKEQEAPSWVTEAASRTLPAFSGKVPAAVLLNEQRATVDASGLVTTVTRHAVKILTHDGKRMAAVTEGYEKGGRQVKQLHAWLLAPSGFVKTYEKSAVEDLGAYNEAFYDDYRLRRIRVDNAEIGAVFAYESEVVEQATSAQDQFAFQIGLPEMDSRYSITVPAGWKAEGTVLNHEPVAPVVDGNTYTWTLRNLPFREPEEAAPELWGTGPMLAVNFLPPPGSSSLPVFKNWSDVSRWHTSISAAQMDISPEIAAKVRQLTAGAATEQDKIRALCHYVQKVRYVEIAMDLGHNGGVRPHPASDVFTNQYGDCKDKANLLRTMLKSAGIESYLVAIYSGDRTFVKKDWPSPGQFNHMIVAIQVSDAVKAPAILTMPLGRLLIFDPTDDLTPMGDLPFYEQGSYALICAAAKGDIAQMPVIDPEANSLTQIVHASIDGGGKLTASLAAESRGQAARRERGKHDTSPEKYRGEIERYLAYYAKSASVAKIETNDSFDQNDFKSTVEFESRGYGQSIQGHLLIFNPVITEASTRYFPTEQQRAQPIVLNGRLYRKQVYVKLPEGFSVDELPAPLKQETEFARFSIAFRQEAGQLIVDEELRTEAVTLPASEYARVKKFFDNVTGANNQDAVLAKN